MPSMRSYASLTAYCVTAANGSHAVSLISTVMVTRTQRVGGRSN